MRRLILLLVVLLSFAVLFAAKGQTIQGYVFIDINSNGVMDDHDEVFYGCFVSNGKDFVQTDENGFFSIEASEESFVFVVVPDGYKCSEWYVKNTANHNFILEPIETKGVFAVVNDIHYADDPDDFHQALGDREMIDNPDYYLEKLAEKLEHVHPDFILCNGDIGASVSDIDDETALRWLETVKDYLTIGSVPAFYTAGNHETNRRKDNPFDIYHSSFGPDYYSFNSHGIHFIVLNTHNVIDGSLVYEIDDRQLGWLKNNIEVLAPGIPIVVFSHEPISDLAKTGNNEQLIQILADNSCYHISGHWHGMFEFFREPFFALTCGGVSGSWWEGPSTYGDEYGFTLFEFRRGVMSYSYVSLVDELSVWFDMNNRTPLSGVERIRVCVYPGTSEAISILLNGEEYECDVVSRQMKYWHEFYFNVNLAVLDDGFNKISVRIDDQVFTKKIFVKNTSVDMKTMKSNPEYFEGSFVLVTDCVNTGQWGSTFVFNDGTDIFMAQIRNVNIPFSIARNQSYSLYGVFRNSNRVADPLKITLGEGVVQDE
jgi:hypothetical protein